MLIVYVNCKKKNIIALYNNFLLNLVDMQFKIILYSQLILNLRYCQHLYYIFDKLHIIFVSDMLTHITRENAHLFEKQEVAQ